MRGKWPATCVPHLLSLSLRPMPSVRAMLATVGAARTGSQACTRARVTTLERSNVVTGRSLCAKALFGWETAPCSLFLSIDSTCESRPFAFASIVSPHTLAVRQTSHHQPPHPHACSPEAANALLTRNCLHKRGRPVCAECKLSGCLVLIASYCMGWNVNANTQQMKMRAQVQGAWASLMAVL